MLFLLGLWPLNFTEKNNAVINPTGGLAIARHGTAYTALPAGKLQELKQFAIYVDLVSSSDGLDSLEKIFGCLISQEAENFFLAQWKDGLEFRVRTERNAAGMIFGADGVFEKDRRTSCLIVYDGQKLSLYKNGTLIRRDTRGPLSFSNWTREYPLAVGSDAGGRSQWRGTIHVIAVFDRTLTSDEVMRLSSPSSLSGLSGPSGRREEADSKIPLYPPFSKGEGIKEREIAAQPSAARNDSKEQDKRPVIHYVFKPENTYETEFRGERALGVRDLGKGEPADLVIPERFVPYKRSYLAWDPDWTKRSSDWLDFIINIVGFMPFGFLLFVQFVRRHVEGDRRQERSQQSTVDSKEVYSPQPTVDSQIPLNPSFAKGEGIKESEIAAHPSDARNDKQQIVAAVGLAVVVGFGVSLAIEWLQAYLPSRDSSLRDLITNGIGTFIGSFVIAVVYLKYGTVRRRE